MTSNKGAETRDLLERCLQDLEDRLNPREEERIEAEWRAFCGREFVGDLFSPSRTISNPPAFVWPQVGINAGLESYENMALQQFGAASQALAKGSGAVLNVRCNYGTGIMPLLFGTELFIMDEKLDTLPTAVPFHDEAWVRAAIDAGIPDLECGYGQQVFEMGAFYRDIAERYPKIGRYVHIYHPDLQGPMDICEVVWGSEMFTALVDNPGMVREFLELATETYIAFMKRWIALVPFEKDANAHWGLMLPGNIMLRDDSAMNLSPRMFDNFIKPYDQRLLDAFGGGAIHFCGRGSHFVPLMSDMPGLYAINLSQPEYNDMEAIFAATVDKGIAIVGLREDAGREAVARGRDLHGLVHIWQQVGDPDKARKDA